MKKIVKDSPYIEGCNVHFVEGEPKERSAGKGSTASNDWRVLFVEALVSDLEHICGTKARDFTEAGLYTEAFTIGGLVLIKDCCYALTTGHSLMRSNLLATVPLDSRYLSLLFLNASLMQPLRI
jgi:hypothetical protein